MKNIKYTLSFVFLLLCIIACSNDDDTAPVIQMEEEEVVNFVVNSIRFLDQDANVLSSSSCIDPSLEYFVQITVANNSDPNVVPTRVDYTFNGALSSVTFTNSNPIQTPVTLREGVNNVQLLSNGQTTNIFLVLPSEFEIVE
ncbi:hypothetical protein ACFO3O_14840 [Dokdonia ponticola]|uniref:DUF4352 domain-containing protein n=1 Tax=Dokdonia ponticola TaxID=2041041 RepID=A0ABV9HYD3_9FLAO